jgi:carbonic anhydrase/acetyltransferase-like protein (isoleucine patch superfamily)
MLYSLGDRRIELRGSHHYIAPNATVIGTVILEHEASLWFNVVVRADNDTIAIGARTNIQDAAVLHTDPGVPMNIGASVSIGHQAMLHGCTVGEGTLIGVKAVVLNHAVIGRDCLIGANALIPEGKVIADRSLVIGSPGKVVRTLTDAEIAGIRGQRR